VTPQAVAYAQIAGLPPEAGLMAAAGAMLAYALLGTSRQLVVSATTAASAVSAAAVGPLAHGDVARFAALSAALALVTAVVLVAGGAFRLGAIADLVSKPVMTGFLFGLGMVITLAQLPGVLGVKPGEGNFFPSLNDVLGELGDVHSATLAVGAGSIAVLLLGRRLLPRFPSTLLVLVVAIVASALLDLSSHGVDVVGHIPNAVPDPAIPHVSANDFVALITPAFGILIMSAEAVGVARALAVKHGYQVDPNRDLQALGASNLLAGLSSGFVDVAELRRFVHVRRSAIVTALLALAGVLALGVRQGLVVTAGLALVYVVQRLSRPSVGALARDAVSGAWGRADRHDGWQAPDGALVAGSDGPLLYPNANMVKDRVLALVGDADERPHTVVVDLSTTTDLDVQSADSLDEPRQQLARDDIELRLAGVRARARVIL
jgi:MFS superfamily sulfate permease-like transporter